MLAALTLVWASVEPTVTLAAVGDILLDRGVQRKIEQHGTLYPFAKVRSVLRGADIALGNLECPLTTAEFEVSKRHRFKASPSLAPMLKNAGFDVLNLANNHMMDCGYQGVQETTEALTSARVQWCGVDYMKFPASVTVNGLRVVFLGFSEFVDSTAGGAGVSKASEGMVELNTKFAAKGDTLVVVSFHWGDELSSKISARQKSLAKAAARGGADLIVGHHPHVLQPMETVSIGNRKVPVVYSLGNFVFDAPAGEQRKTTILMCTLSKRGVIKTEMLPVQIEGCRPVRKGKAKAVRW
jgi:gamma-polyglutamate biosynthesis protein CapA